MGGAPHGGPLGKEACGLAYRRPDTRLLAADDATDSLSREEANRRDTHLQRLCLLFGIRFLGNPRLGPVLKSKVAQLLRPPDPESLRGELKNDLRPTDGRSATRSGALGRQCRGYCPNYGWSIDRLQRADHSNEPHEVVRGDRSFISRLPHRSGSRRTAHHSDDLKTPPARVSRVRVLGLVARMLLWIFDPSRAI